MPKIFDKIVDFKNLFEAYKETQAGEGKYKTSALHFYANETENLLRLQRTLIDETYQFGEYTTFYVWEPKERLIHAPPYHSKIVQLAVNRQVKHIFYSKFIYHSYACIDGKGTHRAVDHLQGMLRRGKRNYGNGAYIVSIDIKKFFYSINRELLKRELKKYIKCSKTLRLLRKIIDSADQIDEIGLPLGNTLSQLFANVMLNKVDQYAKRVLGVKYYVRYADDINLIAPNKKVAREWLEQLEDFTERFVDLEFHPNKTQIFPIDQGINAYGFKIWTTHRLLRNDSKKRIKQKMSKLPRLIREGFMTFEKAEQILNSWAGHAKFANSDNFIKNLLLRHGDWVEYVDRKFRIKEVYFNDD